MKEIKKSGRLILQEIEFSKIKQGTARKHSVTASRVIVPKAWEGEEVYIILPKKKSDTND